MDFRSKSCIFIGYSSNHHGYKCLDLSTGRVYISRHVIFDENFFPFHHKVSSPLPSKTTSSTHVNLPLSPAIPHHASIRNVLTLCPSTSTNESAPLVSQSAGTHAVTTPPLAAATPAASALPDIHSDSIMLPDIGNNIQL